MKATCQKNTFDAILDFVDATLLGQKLKIIQISAAEAEFCLRQLHFNITFCNTGLWPAAMKILSYTTNQVPVSEYINIFFQESYLSRLGRRQERYAIHIVYLLKSRSFETVKIS